MVYDRKARDTIFCVQWFLFSVVTSHINFLLFYFLSLFCTRCFEILNLSAFYTMQSNQFERLWSVSPRVVAAIEENNSSSSSSSNKTTTQVFIYLFFFFFWYFCVSFCQANLNTFAVLNRGFSILFEPFKFSKHFMSSDRASTVNVVVHFSGVCYIC